MAEQTNATENGQTTQPEMVPIPDASDADLDAFLEMARNQEEPEEQEQTEKADAKPEPEQPAQKEPESNPDEVRLTKAQYEELVKKIEKQKQDNNQKELFIKRQANELGALRKQLKERNETLARGLEEKHELSPREAVRTELEIRDNERKIQEIDQREAELHTDLEASRIFTSNVNFEEASLDDMAAALVEDGFSPDDVQAFKANPTRFAAPETLINLHRRARAEKAVRFVVNFAKGLWEENKKLKAKPDEVLEKAERELRKGPSVTGANGRATSSRRGAVNIADVSKLSDGDLDALIEQLGKAE